MERSKNNPPHKGRQSRYQELPAISLLSHAYEIFRACSQIPVVSVTGHATGWPGPLKLPGAAV